MLSFRFDIFGIVPSWILVCQVSASLHRSISKGGYRQLLGVRYALIPDRFVNSRPIVAMSLLSVAKDPIVQTEDDSIIDAVSFRP